MNISRRALLGSAVAVVVTPVTAPIVPSPLLTWTPNPLAEFECTWPAHEIYYGGAAGGGKMNMQDVMRMLNPKPERWYGA